jgi:hypothetical protein
MEKPRMRPILLAFLLVLPALVMKAQRIHYSEAEPEDGRQINFEVIGRVGGQINIYKNYRAKNDVSIYDNEMKLRTRINLEFMPDRVGAVDFVAYPDFYYIIYQYQKKNVAYCSAVKMDGNGKVIAGPFDLDTSHIPSINDNQVYAVVNSDDKQQIMVLKVNRRDERKFLITTILFNKDLQVQARNRVAYPAADHDGVFTDFILDNDGDVAFARCGHSSSREYINRIDFIQKLKDEDSLRVLNIPLDNYMLDEVKVKADNANRRFILSSFYYKQRKGNIDGIYNWVWDKKAQAPAASQPFVLGDTLRLDARTDNASLKTAFNDYFIKHVIPTKDGGFAVLAEMYYTTSRTNNWNRWDYLYGYNAYTPLDYWYYSPYNSMNYYRWWDPYSRYNNYSGTRHYAENIMIFFFDRNAKMSWSNVLRKTQFDDFSDMFLSYQIFVAEGEAHLLYNQMERRELMLNSSSINSRGELKKDPTLHNLDKGYTFMPRFGKQIGASSIVIPCMYKNYICFALVDF